MKSYVGIFLILLVVILAGVSFLSGRHGRVSERAQAQWLASACQTLTSQKPPAAELSHNFLEGSWAGDGYLIFSNGCAACAFHTFHESEKIGDIALLRTSDGVFFTSHFHFCVGELEFLNEPQPRDFPEFLKIYGGKHGWIKSPMPNLSPEQPAADAGVPPSRSTSGIGGYSAHDR
jgi:cytochrome c1